MGFNKCVQRNLTPAAAAPVQLQKQVHLRNVNCPDDDTVGLGTPSAPPIIDSDFPLERDSECSLRNEPTDPPGSWPSRESLDFNDGTKSESSIEQKPKAKTVAEPTVTELAERYYCVLHSLGNFCLEFSFLTSYSVLLIFNSADWTRLLQMT